jgi:hypothetical protein
MRTEIVSADTNVVANVSVSTITAFAAIATYGVRNLGCTRPRADGICPCSAIAIRMRGEASMIACEAPRVDMAAPSVMTADAPGAKLAAASASGPVDAARAGRVPTQTYCTPA